MMVLLILRASSMSARFCLRNDFVAYLGDDIGATASYRAGSVWCLRHDER